MPVHCLKTYIAVEETAGGSKFIAEVAPQDLIATVYHALGVSAEQTISGPAGRPQFIRPGKTIHDLLL